jgi:flavin-dependent dehydrogenase
MAEHRVVIVGAGFAGLKLAHDLRRAPVAITVIDQRNHHLFQPLLYQLNVRESTEIIDDNGSPTDSQFPFVHHKFAHALRLPGF